jgi:multidrug efflux pump subunit AcrB
MKSMLNSGPIAWMAGHGIAPNLLMLALIIGGFITSMNIKKEVFPEFSVDVVQVRLVYPGASPSEMEQGVVLSVENVLTDIDGLDDINASIREGYATLSLNVESGKDTQQVYQDILQAVNRISTFPAQMEQPIVSVVAIKRDVMDIALHGNLTKFELKRLAESVKEKILESPFVTQIEFRGAPAEEIHVEISKLTLEKYNLTLSQVATIIRENAIERSAGTVKTAGGDILVTLNDRIYWANDFAGVPLIQDSNGVTLSLGDVATITEGFENTTNIVTLDGKESIQLRVYRGGDETPTAVVDSIYSMWDQLEAILPDETYLTVVDDDAELYRQRLNLLLKNSFIGLALVFILLGIFLEYRLAFWVTMGIPTSFLGAMLFLPYFDVSINMVSMFAFIIALGIVVDDAIIAGENIYENLAKGKTRLQAAIEGAQQVKIPLTFSILTNIVAFLPLMFIEGGFGKVMMAIPAVVVMCFAISWIEALFILPSHIAHLSDEKPKSKIVIALDKLQVSIDKKLVYFIHNHYRPLATKLIDNPGVSLAIAVAIASVVLAMPMSGRMGFTQFPVLEGESAVVNIEMPQNATQKQAEAARDLGEMALKQVITPIENEFGKFLVSTTSRISDTSIEIDARLIPGENRPYTTNQVVTLWREALGEVAGVKSISFDAERGGGPSSGRPFTLELRGANADELANASAKLVSILESLNAVKDVESSLTNGNPEWDIKLNDNGRSLGLTASNVVDQVRNNLYGARALRQQRGKNEVTVLVRLPEEERSFQRDIERLLIVTPSGARVPLNSIATLVKGTSPAKITRKNGTQVVTIGSAVEPRSLIPTIQSTLEKEYFPELAAKFPSVNIGYGGRQADNSKSLGSLKQGLIFALIGIYILLAIPFRSYKQPLLIMIVIPFGAVGALCGLLLLDLGLTIIAIMGMLALCGVVVNDSLILIDYANKLREKGVDIKDAILEACERRFRPILLTTLTTFGGLAPMVFETSRQAKFITPMAVSLGFGILFTTFVCLLILPALYVVLDKSYVRRFINFVCSITRIPFRFSI